MNTPPIGYNAAGEPIEEVVTTATRLRPGTWPALLGAIALVLGFAYLGYQVADPARPRRARIQKSKAVRRARGGV